MDDEEVDGLLRTLRATLAEFGSPSVVPPRYPDPEEGEPDNRDELHRVLEEYEAILVSAPKMMKATMGMLGARSLHFVADPDDRRFTIRGVDPPIQRLPEVFLTSDKIETWLKVASEANEVITLLRERLNDQPR